MGKLIIIMGVSASGKDTLLNEIVKNGIPRMVSYTTRPMRQGEEEGIHYNFVTKEQFDEDVANDDVIEHREYNVADGSTWYYYFKKNTINLANGDYCCISDVKGTSDLVNYFGKANTTVVWLNTPLDTCIMRSLLRESPTTIKVKEMCRRMLSDIEEFIENDRTEELADIIYSMNSSWGTYEILEAINKELEGDN